MHVESFGESKGRRPVAVFRALSSIEAEDSSSLAACSFPVAI